MYLIELIALTVFHLIQLLLMERNTDKMKAEKCETWITNTISIGDPHKLI